MKRVVVFSEIYWGLKFEMYRSTSTGDLNLWGWELGAELIVRSRVPPILVVAPLNSSLDRPTSPFIR
jgi:hypothetical protein